MCVFAKFNHLSDMLFSPTIYFGPQNFSQSSPKKTRLVGWSSTRRKLEQRTAIVDGGGKKKKHPILVIFSLKLYGTPMFWSRGMKAGKKLTFVSSICLLQFFQNPHKFGKAVKLLTISIYAYSAARSWISGVHSSLCPKSTRDRVEGEGTRSVCCPFPLGF